MDNFTFPLDSFLFGLVCEALRREYGKKACEKVSLEECIAYWRRNISKYPRHLTYRELLAIEDKEEFEMEK